MEIANNSETSLRFTWLSWIGLILILLIVVACILAFFQPSTFHSVGEALAFGNSGRAAQGGSTGAACNTGTSSGAGLKATITPAPSATPSPTAAPKETIVAAFAAGGHAARTQYEYSGPVTLTITGDGQAAGKAFSDAFYIYTDQQEQPVTPHLKPAFATLCINGQAASTLVQAVPAYSESHRYTVTINAPKGFLTFGVCDNNPSDNTGAFVVEIA